MSASSMVDQGRGRCATPPVVVARRLCATLLLVGCLGQLSTTVGARSLASVEPLGPGLHLGYGTFSPVEPERLTALDARVVEATAAGMDVARVMVDWAEIETEPGSYDPTLLDDQLDRVPDGARLLLTLGVTDVDRYALPADSLTADGSPAAPLDDPGVTGRYLALLDDVLPRLVEDHGLFALSVANEPDVLLAERPADEAASLAAFTTSVGDYAAEWFPSLPVTMTISGGGVADASPFLPDLIAATDVAAFNWGCIDLADFTVTDPATIPGEIALLLETAGDRDIVVQELSCPAGYVDEASTIGSSEERQAAWFAAFFAATAAEPRFRAALVFELVDWPAELAAAYAEFLRAEGLGVIADR